MWTAGGAPWPLCVPESERRTYSKGWQARRTHARPPSKPSAILPPAAAGAENAAIGTLVVSEAQMVRMFSGLPVEAKVAALQAYLDGQQ